jgi:hypothetical protein
MVRLVCGDSEITVSVEQAESIFYLQRETQITNWQLPLDSPYQLVNGKLNKSAGTKVIPGTAKKKRG